MYIRWSMAAVRVGALTLLALALTVGIGSPALARARHKPKPKPTPVPAETAPAKAAPNRRAVQPAPRIPLQRNLRFILRPTLLGLVPPPDPLDLGEAYVRVLGADDSRIVTRYEIKEQVVQDPATGEVYPLSQPPPDTKTKPLLRIRRGDVEARRHGATPQIVSPLFWTTGNWKTDCGLLWLDPALLAALKAGGHPAWEIAFPADALDAAGFRQLEAIRRLSVGLAADAPVQLNLLQAGAGYRCLVNGAPVDLPAVRATDSMLLAEYWFLDDPANPLLLKMNYLPLRDPQPGESGWAGVINAGGGFAVTTIDF